MRKKIVAGNWKMNLGLHQADILLSQILEDREEFPKDVHVIVAPPAIYLARFAKRLKGIEGISIAAQNCAHQNQGAFTGEISAEMLRSIGVDYTLIGHSERRHFFGEKDELLAQKVTSALEFQLWPIFCVGEQLEDRDANKQEEVVEKQLQNGIFHLEPEQFSKVILAYEPVWAIGTGRTASPEQADQMHRAMRNMVEKKYGAEIAENTAILYGGSCKPDNAKSLFELKNVDGGLIGGAALKASSFTKIIKSAG